MQVIALKVNDTFDETSSSKIAYKRKQQAWNLYYASCVDSNSLYYNRWGTERSSIFCEKSIVFKTGKRNKKAHSKLFVFIFVIVSFGLFRSLLSRLDVIRLYRLSVVVSATTSASLPVFEDMAKETEPVDLSPILTASRSCIVTEY